MEMTPLQIASEYRTGKDKSKTIKVLAELNLVTQRTIAQILDEQGEELPGHWKEKLATPLKRPPKERIATAAAACHDKEGAVTPGELAEAIVEAMTPEGTDGENGGPTRASAPTEKPDGRQVAAPAEDGAALSQDESRQAAPTGICWAQYSRLQLLIGRLEGMSPGPLTGIGTFYDDTVRQLADLADELRPTV